MKRTLEIELSEQDINNAIKDFIYKNNKDISTILNLRYITSVRGDYDKGNAEEYVKKVYCECK